jgi:ligand-binding sensor domain-containing protein
VRILTDLDDARACEPLDGGTIAVATGGGLAIASGDGSVRVLTSLDGLPETRVHAIALSREGDALWVGTAGGAALVSLAGHTPRVVRAMTGAPVEAVHVAADGAVYLGTRGAGALRLASRDAAPEPIPSATGATHAAAIADRDGVVYVAFADGPLSSTVHDPHSPSGPLSSSVRDPASPSGPMLRPVGGGPSHGQSLVNVAGELVLGDLEGLYRVDSDGFAPLASVDARGLAAGGTALFVAAYGLGVETGGAHGAFHADPGVSRRARGVGARGGARCVATGDGLFVDQGTGSFHRIELGGPPSNDITALAVSPSGRVALGTFEDGASIRDGDGFHRIAGVARHETINGVAWQEDRLWLATAHGLVRIAPDGTARTFTSADGLPGTLARAVHALSARRVLVGTDAGPAIVDDDRVVALGERGAKGRASRGLTSPMRSTYAVGSSADGTLFVGTTAGLYYGTLARGFRRASVATGELADDWVTAITTDGRDVFVGTYANGVTRLRFEAGTAAPRPVHLGGGYVNDDGLTIARGQLWASTMDGLLVRDATDRGDASHWERRASLSPGRDVTAVRFAGEAMWVASRRGLALVDTH